MPRIDLMHGDCLEEMSKIPDNFVDSIVTDPPYELGFMGKKWDSTGIAYNVDVWEECLRVLKPGGHLLAFGGTRTSHRMACAIEDAGFEIRDQMQWLYGSGFPKSMDIGKAIDKIQGNERDIVGSTTSGKILRANGQNERPYQQGKDRITTDITKGNSEWEGWGTCLKPSNEPICLARKPISEKTIADNVLKWGTGGLNIDACRIQTSDNVSGTGGSRKEKLTGDTRSDVGSGMFASGDGVGYEQNPNGRFPANIILDEEAGLLLDEQAPKTGAFAPVRSGYNGESNGIYGDYSSKGDDGASFYSDGLKGASRFFYCAKASKSERGEGNFHPTVKPIKLIEYLVKLVTPPNGIVLDPFMGSGSTGVACINTNRGFIGIELDEDYYNIACKRITEAQEKGEQMKWEEAQNA